MYADRDHFTEEKSAKIVLDAILPKIIVDDHSFEVFCDGVRACLVC